MGVCGCGDFNGARWAVTVKGRVLAVSEYDGCNNGCAAPLGFSVHLLTKARAREWDIEPTGEWAPDEYGWSEQFLNFFSQDELVAAAREMDVDLSDYDSLADVLEEVGLDLMREAWRRTKEHEADLRKRFGEAPPFASPPRAEEG